MSQVNQSIGSAPSEASHQTKETHRELDKYESLEALIAGGSNATPGFSHVKESKDQRNPVHQQLPLTSRQNANSEDNQEQKVGAENDDMEIEKQRGLNKDIHVLNGVPGGVRRFTATLLEHQPYSTGSPSTKTDDPPSTSKESPAEGAPIGSAEITSKTKLSDLGKVPIETVASLGGWTAKRVSITGQLFFERDADGVIQLDRPQEALAVVKQSEELDDEDDSDVEDPELVKSSNGQEQSEKIVSPSPSSSPPPETPSMVIVSSSEKPFPLDEATLVQIHAVEGNDRCVDCGAGGQNGPTWASVSFGVLLCMQCSGNHRGFGSHISAVKSLTLDNWTTEQLLYLVPHGGNAKFKQAVKIDGKPSARYMTSEASIYRARLRALVRGEPLPEQQVSVKPVQTSALGLFASEARPPASPARKARNLRESKEATACMICGRSFSVVVRKHFCRNCDRAVCSRCAPAANTKPLPQLGLGMTPLRHCSQCYRSPFIDWSSVGLTSAEQAAEASVAAEGTSTGASMRRKTLGERKARRKTLGDAIVGLMKRG